jgi:hypothetical protein
MNVNLATQVGQPYNAATVATDVKTLWSIGRFSDVRVETVPDGDGVDVRFHVVREPRYSIRELRFEPHPYGLQINLQPGTLLTRAEAAKIAADARTHLNDSGYTAARVDWRFAPTPGGRYNLMLKIDAGDMAKHRPKPPQLPLAEPDTCSALFEERREAERKGILDFTASMDPSGVASVERGRSYTLGRLTFYGHHHYSDAEVRRHFLLDEGAPLDMFLLRQSVVRLNQAALFEPVDEHQVHIATNDRTGTADVVINLTERKRRSWSFSGPLPISASIAGRVIGTYGISFHLIAFDTILKLATNKKLLPVFAAERAFTPGDGWWSGISFAPQLGLRSTLLGYASTQLQQRLLPKLAGTRAPDLTIANGESALLCRYPKPKLATVRMGASVVLRFAGTVGGLQ